MPKIIIHLPDGSSAKYGLNGPTFTIGRAADNDIVLPPGAASSHHAVLRIQEGGDFAVTDLDSTNKTQVNGRAVETRVLRHGDGLLFGDVRAEYQSEVVGRAVPMEEQPTRIYEQGVPAAAAARLAPVVLAPAVVARPVSTVARRGSSSQDGGCFALLVFGLVLPAAFFGGLVLRHHQEKGEWFWDYLQRYIHS